MSIKYVYEYMSTQEVFQYSYEYKYYAYYKLQYKYKYRLQVLSSKYKYKYWYSQVQVWYIIICQQVISIIYRVDIKLILFSSLLSEFMSKFDDINSENSDENSTFDQMLIH